MLSQYLEKIKNENIGVIVNYFSKQFLNKQYNIFQLPTSNYVDYINLNEINTIFIDNDVYETDHKWFNKEINGLLAHCKLNNITIILIKNTSKKIVNTLLDFYQIDLNLDNSVETYDKGIRIPIIVDEIQYNPINLNKKLDILYLSTKKIFRTEGIQSLHINIKPVREEFILTDLSRKEIKTLVSKIKEAKCLYIYNPEQFDPIILRYIEIISILQNTNVLYTSELVKSDIATIDVDVNIVNKLVVLIKNKLIREKECLPKQRMTFLNNTFMKFDGLHSLANVTKNNIGISVISSTNRKHNLNKYIENINQQTHVNLQVVLVTHGFELTAEETEELYSRLNRKIDFQIIYINEEAPLGVCLNAAIKNIKYDYVAKMDDDDFYFNNYLIDSWIASKYASADLVGKLTSYTFLENANLIIMKHKNTNRKYNNFVMGATFFAKSSLMKKYMFSNLPTGEDSDFLRRINEDNAIIYADQPYNFCIYRSGDIGTHTWKISDLEYMKNSEIVSFKTPRDLLLF